FNAAATAQTYTLSLHDALPICGKVTAADNGAPLSGVSITVVGSTIATSTDDDGNYAITVPSNFDEVRFLYLGYETQQHSIANYADRKSTRLNSSHVKSSYAVFC